MDATTKQLAAFLGLPKNTIKATLVLSAGDYPLLRVTTRVLHLPASAAGIAHETKTFELVPRDFRDTSVDFTAFPIGGISQLGGLDNER